MAQFKVARVPVIRENCCFHHTEDGFQYFESGRRQGRTYFKCICAGRGCRGLATLDEVDGFVQIAAHDHEPDPFFPDVMALRRIILRRCEESDASTTFRSIILMEGHRFAPEVAARVSYERMYKSMLNARKKNSPAFLPAHSTE